MYSPSLFIPFLLAPPSPCTWHLSVVSVVLPFSTNSPKTRQVQGSPRELGEDQLLKLIVEKQKALDCRPRLNGIPICPLGKCLLITWLFSIPSRCLEQRRKFYSGPKWLTGSPTFSLSSRQPSAWTRPYFSSFPLWQQPEWPRNPHILSVVRLSPSPEADSLPLSRPDYSEVDRDLAETKLSRLTLTRAPATSGARLSLCFSWEHPTVYPLHRPSGTPLCAWLSA